MKTLIAEVERAKKADSGEIANRENNVGEMNKSMKMNRTLALLVVVSAAYATSTGLIQGQTVDPAFQEPAGLPSFTYPLNLGMVFTPNVSISVDALGFYDTLGVTAAETVAIYDSTGNLITSTSVGLTDLQYSYFWQSITPVDLQAGQQYTVAAFTGSNPVSYGPVSSLTVIPYITYDYDSTGYQGVPGFPGGGGDGGQYAGPNFSDAPVPDGASTAMLCGMSLLALGWFRRKLA